MSTKEEKLITGFLKLVSGQIEQLSFDMYGSEMHLGRNSSSLLCIVHRSVSRNHCIFRYTSEGWSVRDNKSQNGTFVNETQVKPEEFYPIKDGDCIYLGNPVIPHCLSFRFYSHKPENLPEQQKTSMHSPDETDGENRDPEEINGNAPSRNCLKRKMGEDKPQQTEMNCAGAHQASVDSRSLPCNFASSLLSPTKVSPNKSTAANRLRNQKKKVSAQKFMHYLNELNTKSPEKSKVIIDPEEIVIDSSLSLIGAECEISDVDFSYSPSEDVYLEELKSETPKDIECNSESSQQLSKIQELHDKISSLEADAEKMKRELQEKSESLEAHVLKMKEMEKNIEARLSSTKKDFYQKIKGKFEEELLCNICTELLLKATVLGCSHTYCEHCIHEWKKKKRQCPICREPITIEYRVLLIDNLIDKFVESYQPEMAEKRKELLKVRSEMSQAGKKKRKRSRSSSARLRNTRSRTVGANTNGNSDSNANSDQNADSYQNESIIVEDFHDALIDAFLDSPDLAEGVLLADLSDLSEEDSPMDGYGYYGGYGRCFNCGRRGHWANGCPEF